MKRIKGETELSPEKKLLRAIFDEKPRKVKARKAKDVSLSSKPQRIIDFVRRFWTERGYQPTVRDIVSGCRMSSTSGVEYNLDILEREGYIRRHAGVSLGIERLDR